MRRPSRCTQKTPFTPEHIVTDGRRWFHDGRDVTDLPVWWLCPNGHDYQETIGQRVDGVGCPACGE